MLLQEKASGDLIEILEVKDLIDPSKDTISGQAQGGQNEQPPESFGKNDLKFPSGEELPRCWLDANYRQNMPPQ
ncbi:acetyltransferase [Oculatella sp. LEGE 06141]|uniref:acetyltransferase n=1 Tax=Oculatella sp. LEGE 06141 TaxID=1828648 RepID=UPI00187F6BCC|nr:acetyltransferase [Oculatella sp. LEGE 06141]MBE9181204.1 acetyltransferase [Oculatella sp. LEGE 06141]